MRFYPIRERPYRCGDIVRIKPCTSHVIQFGLADGAQVRVIQIDHGTVDVDFQGQRFQVPMVLVDNGIDYEVNGRWVAERPKG